MTGVEMKPMAKSLGGFRAAVLAGWIALGAAGVWYARSKDILGRQPSAASRGGTPDGAASSPGGWANLSLGAIRRLRAHPTLEQFSGRSSGPPRLPAELDAPVPVYLIPRTW